MKNQSCCILGSPPLSFPWGYDEEDENCVALKLVLFNKITFLRNQGVTDFYVVIDAGIGLYAAEIINGLRESDGELRLICVVPWEGQATKWTPDLRDRYFSTMENCNDVRTVSPTHTSRCEIIAMLNAIDEVDHVIAIQGEDTALLSVALHYAERLNKQIER